MRCLFTPRLKGFFKRGVRKGEQCRREPTLVVNGTIIIPKKSLPSNVQSLTTRYKSGKCESDQQSIVFNLIYLSVVYRVGRKSADDLHTILLKLEL